MKTSSTVRLSCMAIVIAFMALAPASAAQIRYEQMWDAAAQPEVQGNIITTAFWDDSTITGVGREFVTLTYFGVLRELNGIGQNFSTALLPGPEAPPPSAGGPNTMAAFYQDGVLQVVGNVTGSGNGFVSLTSDGTTPNGLGVSFRQRAGIYQLLYALPVSGQWNYNLVSSEIIVPSPDPVPLPGAAIPFLFGAAMIGAARRFAKTVS
ncbi:MAG: hypothetical protein AAFR65_09505 [Pseudomonadota bacterium]